MRNEITTAALTVLVNVVLSVCDTFSKHLNSLQSKIRILVFIIFFRSGSVIADIKITYSSNTAEPRKPLEDAIKTGTFAGHAVRTSFVSPTAGMYFSYF